MKCPKCDTDNPSDSKFCKECATPFPPYDISVTKTLEIPKTELLTGSTFAGRYQIIEELGAGGMGTVYKAHDTEIKEKIAIKLLKPEISAHKKMIERFQNELKYARKISHRNVCRMYDLNKDSGSYYITMEYVEGEDLKRMIQMMGRLSIGKAVSIARQVCEGLVESHSLDVIHRDLKPSNIMIDRLGNAKIMDFGIARSLESDKLTGTGVMIGTPEYMSPEQVEGMEIDARCDIYSLGVVLYEMVTGQLPFEGRTQISTAMKHLNETPQDPRELNAQISQDLSRVILRCLEKDREQRFRSAEELLFELADIEKGIPTTERTAPTRKPRTSKEITVSFNLRKLFIPALVLSIVVIVAIIMWQFLPEKETPLFESGRPSVAVLPFDDLSPAKDQEFFCQGFAESLITALSKIKDLRIPAKTSSFSFKGKEQEFKEIGEKLDVETVLMGSVQRAEDRIRITIQLVKIADESILWSEQFSREMSDIFAIQDQITLEIVRELKGTLLGEDKEILVKRYTENAEAYNLYLQGRFFWEKRTEEGFKKAVDYFEKAIEMDPDFALAYAGLANTYGTFIGYGFLSMEEAAPKIMTLLEKALSIDDELAEAHTLMAQMAKTYYWDWEKAEKGFKLAIKLNPNYVYAHMWYGIYLADRGQIDEALKEQKRAYELDPLNLVLNYSEGNFNILAKRYDEAIQTFRKTLSMDPNFIPAYYGLANAYLLKSQYDKALQEVDKAWEISKGSSVELLSLRGSIYAKAGNRIEAEKDLEELSQLSQQRYVSPDLIASLYVALGQKDQAFEWLDKAFSERCNGLVKLKIAPEWDDLRTDPRFSELLKKIGLENEKHRE